MKNHTGSQSSPGALGPLLEDDLDWQDAALCAQSDPEAWFPEKGGSTREAKRVCRSCPVRAECLEYAFENGERFGIWGGLSERERREAIRLKRTVRQAIADDTARRIRQAHKAAERQDRRAEREREQRAAAASRDRMAKAS